MNATNCPRCGRLFTKFRAPVCPACEKAEEETFKRIVEYIEENPLCNMRELSEAVNVPIKIITQYIRDGRLEVSKGMMGDITCSSCGKPISSGRYCEACATDISMGVNELFGKGPAGKDEDGKARMFTIGRQKKL